MKATIETASIATAHANKVTAGNVRIGAVHIGRVALRDVHVGHPEGAVELRGVRILLDLSTVLDVKLEVAGLTRTGHFTQDPVRLSLLHRDIRVSLPKGIRTLHAGEIAVTDVNATAATVKPEQPLDLGRLVASVIRASGIESSDPVVAFPSSSLAEGPRMRADRIVVERLRNHDLPQPGPPPAKPPAREVGIRSVTVGEVSLGTLPIAQLSMAGPAIPRVSFEPLRAESVVIDGPAIVREWKDDDGVLQGQLRIEASARLEIESVEVSLAAELGVGTVELLDVRLPLELEDLCMSELGLANIDVPLVEVG